MGLAIDQRVENSGSWLSRRTAVSLLMPVVAMILVLDGVVTVTVFERFRPNSREEVAALSARLRSAYPDRPEIYSP